MLLRSRSSQKEKMNHFEFTIQCCYILYLCYNISVVKIKWLKHHCPIMAEKKLFMHFIYHIIFSTSTDNTPVEVRKGFSKTKVECIISMKDEGILMENKDTELILKAIGHINDQLEGINSRLNGIDSRLDNVDGRLDGIDSRLDNVDGRLDGVDNRLNSMDKKIDDLREDMEIEFAAVHREINNVYQLAKGIMKTLRNYLKSKAVPEWTRWKPELRFWKKSTENKNKPKYQGAINSTLFSFSAFAESFSKKEKTTIV